MSNAYPAFAALIGTIIGAGILGIPYVVTQSGFTLGLIHIIGIAILMIITMLYLGEIALRTKTNHHLVGYASLYLGKKGRLLMLIAMIFSVYSAVLAYLIGISGSLSFLFFETTSYQLYFGIALWLLMSLFIYHGLKALKEGESIGFIIILILIISIIVLFWNKVSPENLSYVNISNAFVPFGVILFAFLGFTAIPEVKRILGKETNHLKKIIIFANLVTLVIYILFALIVIGSQGRATPELATLALGKPFILFGILTMFTSYLALSTALIDTIRFDFRKTKIKAWLYTIIIPLILFIILEITKKASFTKILGIGGVISGGLMAILILFMVKNAKKQGSRKPEYSIPYSSILTWLLTAIFIIGTILELMNTI